VISRKFDEDRFRLAPHHPITAITLRYDAITIPAAASPTQQEQHSSYLCIRYPLMKHRLSFWAFSAAFLTVAAVSCKKDPDPPAGDNATRIIGSWRQSYEAIDSNNNGRPDSSERIPTTDYRVISFYSNGNVHDTAFVNDTASSRNSTYSVTGDYLSIFSRGLTPNRILQLDAATLMLRDSSTRPAMITAFSKQQ